MAFSFEKYEEIARKLTDNLDEESVRTVISRAYYSLFHRAKPLCRDNGIGFGSHEKIILGIANNPDVKEGKKLSRMLDNCKQDRVMADYYSVPKHPLVFNQKYLKDSFWIRFDLIAGMIDQNLKKEENN